MYLVGLNSFRHETEEGAVHRRSLRQHNLRAVGRGGNFVSPGALERPADSKRSPL